MKTRECIRCEKIFECKGKEKDKPCLHFVERKEVKRGGTIYDRLTSKDGDSSR